ncbi:ComF family protein [Roseospira visakhapatnamensis]|uniref:ComF family protein n=1 Tax=Roseospira visakhapatnamensis TaxID=390880 RepID=A0A7W6W999_9PROT|nr:ComF family protein [Roseospira visakhapatnamensis]MBB4265266.1 ComF family protein [Roseospira visakhapatnamensis]
MDDARPRSATGPPGAGQRVLRSLLDLVLPPRCLNCGDLVAEPGALCGACFAAAAFITAPLCDRCGTPFADALGDPGETGGAIGGAVGGDAVICRSCRRRPPAYNRSRAVLVYDDHSRALVLAFKHGDRTDAARPLAAWMARAGAPLLASTDLIVPVPLHRWRLWRRRYNQAALLARALARRSGRPWDPLALARRRATPSQGGLGRPGRVANVRGAFRVPDPARVAGRRVLLVDDVLTTGATVEECARVLRRAGALTVDVLTLARVVVPALGPE